MIEYYIRFFTVSPLYSIIPLQAQMAQAGYKVTPAGTNQLEIAYSHDFSPFTVELTDSGNNMTKQEVADFLAAVQDSEDEGRETVLNLLTQTQAIIAIGVPKDLGDSKSLDMIVDIISDMGEGLYHVEGEGFYQGNDLILQL